MNIDILTALEELGYYKIPIADLYSQLSIMGYNIQNATDAVAQAFKDELIYYREELIYLDLRNQGYAIGSYFFPCKVCGSDWWQGGDPGLKAGGDKYSWMCRTHALEALEESLKTADSVSRVYKLIMTDIRNGKIPHKLGIEGDDIQKYMYDANVNHKNELEIWDKLLADPTLMIRE